MPEIVTCPQCERKLKVPESLAGQAVKCPSCGATFTASTTAAEPPPAPSRPPAGPAPREEDVDEPEPRHGAPTRRRFEDDEEDDDRPRRRRPAYDDEEDDDDYEDRPRRRRRFRRDYAPHRGGAILTMGILALVGCFSIILGPIAWAMGNSDLNEIRAGRMDPEGEGTTRAGMICGMIATILSILGCGLWILIFAAGGMGRGRF